MRIRIGALFGLSLAALAAIGPVTAADMTAPAYKAAPVPVFSWSGLYVGGTVGGGMASLPVTQLDDFIGNTLPGQTLKSLGAAGGLHAGYNWQFAPSFLFGIEGDFNWSSLKASDSTCFADCIDDERVTTSSKLGQFSTFRARFGLTSDRTLVYVTAGPAWGHINASMTDFNCTAAVCFNPGAPNAIASDSSFRIGVALGGGVEYALTANWILRGEYLHLDFSNKDTVLKDPTTGIPFIGFDGISNFRVRSSATADIARLGVSYKFW